MSIYDSEIFVTLSRIDLSMLSVNFSYVCFINDEIFEKMSSGGLEVSFNIFIQRYPHFCQAMATRANILLI